MDLNSENLENFVFILNLNFLISYLVSNEFKSVIRNNILVLEDFLFSSFLYVVGDIRGGCSNFN